MKMKDITLKNNNYKSYDLGVSTKIVNSEKIDRKYKWYKKNRHRPVFIYIQQMYHLDILIHNSILN